MTVLQLGERKLLLAPISQRGENMIFSKNVFSFPLGEQNRNTPLCVRRRKQADTPATACANFFPPLLTRRKKAWLKAAIWRKLGKEIPPFPNPSCQKRGKRGKKFLASGKGNNLLNCIFYIPVLAKETKKSSDLILPKMFSKPVGLKKGWKALKYQQIQF